MIFLSVITQAYYLGTSDRFLTSHVPTNFKMGYFNLTKTHQYLSVSVIKGLWPVDEVHVVLRTTTVLGAGTTFQANNNSGDIC